MADYIIQLKDISKNYGGIQALKDITLGFERGMIHALLGENGAGKSTLIRSLSGVEKPTKGDIIFEGKSTLKLSPKQIHDLGISTVYQEPMQAPHMSVLENIYLGRMEKKGGVWIDKKKMREKLLRLMEDTEIYLDPDTEICKLGTAQRQMVEILKALSSDAKFVIFDEPTSSLTNDETEILFNQMKSMKKRGITVLYISHRMAEIFELCDRVTIFRDGMYIESNFLSEYTSDKLIQTMIGREIGDWFYKKEVKIGDEILSAEKISTGYLKDVSFKLRKGEIIGFAGLVGAGRTEVAKVLFGLDKFTGSIMFENEQYHPKSPRDAMNKGVVLVPEDRKIEGVVHTMNVRENITLPNLKALKKVLFVGRKREAGMGREMMERLKIKASGLRQLVSNLSGGNQQKVVFAKWLATEPKIMILDEPTRGIDVGAKAEIYRIISDLVERGISIILMSSEMPELIALCDGIYTMKDGKITGSLDRREFSEKAILTKIIEED